MVREAVLTKQANRCVITNCDNCHEGFKQDGVLNHKERTSHFDRRVREGLREEAPCEQTAEGAQAALKPGRGGSGTHRHEVPYEDLSPP